MLAALLRCQVSKINYFKICTCVTCVILPPLVTNHCYFYRKYLEPNEKMETALDKRMQSYWVIIKQLEDKINICEANGKDTLSLVLDCIKNARSVLIQGNPSKTTSKQEELKPVLNVANAGSQSKNGAIPEGEPGPSHEVLTSKATPPSADNLSKAEKEKKDGDLFFYKKLYVNAIINYSRAIRFNPGDVTLFFKRGVAYSLLGHQKHSISNFERAIELDPSFRATYEYLIKAYIAQGQFCDAKQILCKAINNEPENKKLKEMLDVVDEQLLAEERDRLGSSKSTHSDFGTEKPTNVEISASKYSEDISHAATLLLRDPGSANIINGLLQHSKAKQNPLLEMLTYMRDKLDLNQMESVYKLPLDNCLETYPGNKE